MNPTDPTNPQQQEASTPVVIQPTVISPTNVPAAEQPVAAVSAEHAPVTPPVKKGRFSNKKRMIGGGIFATLLLAGLGFYFGFYTNSGLLYKQALGNTAFGYNKLIDYAEAYKTTQNKGYQGKGNYTFTSGDSKGSGSLNVQGDGEKFDMNFTLSASGLDINGAMRVLQTDQKQPEVYLKAGGISGLGSLVGTADMAAKLKTLDGVWIKVDSDLLKATLLSASVSQTNTPTKAQIVDAAKAFGVVNKEYLYSTKADKAVLRLVKTHGSESLDGRRTYHYTVGFNKANVKKYVQAQQAALKASKLQAWITENKYQDLVDAVFTDMIKSTDDITDSDTFDMWADAGLRSIYKIRLINEQDNPAQNYIDFGLNYKGGSTFPFFVTSKSKNESGASAFTLKADLNTKTSETAVKFEYTADATKAKANFTLKPSATSPKIDTPKNSVLLSQVLQQLGYGDYVTQLQSSLNAINAANSEDTTGL